MYYLRLSLVLVTLALIAIHPQSTAAKATFSSGACLATAPIDRTVDCGTVTLPLSADVPNGTQIQLPIMIVRSSESNNNRPLFLLQGGPGGNTIDTFVSIINNTQTKNGETVPSGLRFENKASDFRNDYRFMSTEIVNEKLKDLKAKTSIKWNVSVQPSVANIQRFKFQSQANTEEPVFVAKTDGSKLKFHFGDPSSMNGEFVFDNGISGALTKAWQFPVAPVISILNLLGDKTLQISDQGALQIIVDSGTAEYTYTLPAQVK